MQFTETSEKVRTTWKYIWYLVDVSFWGLSAVFLSLREKFPNTEFFSGPHFPVFGLNTDMYTVNIRI